MEPHVFVLNNHFIIRYFAFFGAVNNPLDLMFGKLAGIGGGGGDATTGVRETLDNLDFAVFLTGIVVSPGLCHASRW